MLPNLLAHGVADARLMRRLARRVARFHATAATGQGVDEFGSLATVTANWKENLSQIAPFMDRVVSSGVIDFLRHYVVGLPERARRPARAPRGERPCS